MLVNRFSTNPVISPNMDSRMGNNVNGPSLIRVPDWLENPLGRYYLYFGHHDGAYIRLAYANNIEGPWRMHEPGVLPLTDSGFKGHIASPDVHVDDEQRRIRMYFHGCDVSTFEDGPQYTRVATSNDGLEFDARSENLGLSYFRVFEYNNMHYALQMPGVMLRSEDPLTGFETGPSLFPTTMRHSAVAVHGDRLCVTWTNVGDKPESILQTWIDLSKPWEQWQAETSTLVLSPKFDYEGAQEPNEPSTRGLVEGPANQLRDPAILIESDQAYLFYSIAGEFGIAGAEIASW